MSSDDNVAVGTLKSLRELSLAEALELWQQGKPLGQALSGSNVRDLGDGRILKRGRNVCKAEALAMQYVRERTSIPIPRVFAYVSSPGQNRMTRIGYLVMEELPGVRLLDVLENLNTRTKKVMTRNLKEIVSELRTLDEPSRWGMIGKGGVFHGGFFSYGDPDDGCHPSSPHALADIRDYFVSSMGPFNDARYEAGGRCQDEIGPAFHEHDSVFSHADLRPENILVDPDTLRITGIIDWEWAGWYPRFWDHLVAARAEIACKSTDARRNWRDIYRNVFALHDEEAHAFNILLYDVSECGRCDYHGWCKCCKD